jgi:hypothetical protein
VSAPDLTRFVALVNARSDIQERLRQCLYPEDIIELALEFGYIINYMDLRLGVGDPENACNHWPWSSEDSQARRLFFLQEPKAPSSKIYIFPSQPRADTD